MTTVNFKNSVIAVAIGLSVVSCGGRGGNQQSGTETSESAKVETTTKSDGDKWPSNEFTKQVPKPDLTIYAAEDGPNGYNVDFIGATFEQIKAYADKVKAAGFDKVVNEDSDSDMYSYSANNAAGWRVVVSKSGAGSFMIIMKP